jgi:hypothetical protein
MGNLEGADNMAEGIEESKKGWGTGLCFEGSLSLQGRRLSFQRRDGPEDKAIPEVTPRSPLHRQKINRSQERQMMIRNVKGWPSGQRKEWYTLTANPNWVMLRVAEAPDK